MRFAQIRLVGRNADAAGFVIGRDDHQRVRMIPGKIQRRFGKEMVHQRAVETQIRIVRMSAFVREVPFDHQKESVGGGVELFKRGCGKTGEKVGAAPVGEKSVSGGSGREVFQRFRSGGLPVACAPEFGKKIPTVCPASSLLLRKEGFRIGADENHTPGGGNVRGDRFRLAAVIRMGEKRGGRGSREGIRRQNADAFSGIPG